MTKFLTLKHLLLLMGLNLDLFYRVTLFSGAWDFCKVEGKIVVGLGGGNELSLLKG